MPGYRRHLFVCENRRDPGNPKGCCASKGAAQVRTRLKQRVYEAGLKGVVRVNGSGCLGYCEHGTTVVVYPEAVWYGGVSADDADELLAEHLIGGRPVERLRIPHLREPAPDEA